MPEVNLEFISKMINKIKEEKDSTYRIQQSYALQLKERGSFSSDNRLLEGENLLERVNKDNFKSILY